jgi:hypothetical protein
MRENHSLFFVDILNLAGGRTFYATTIPQHTMTNEDENRCSSKNAPGDLNAPEHQTSGRESSNQVCPCPTVSGQVKSGFVETNA